MKLKKLDDYTMGYNTSGAYVNYEQLMVEEKIKVLKEKLNEIIDYLEKQEAK